MLCKYILCVCLPAQHAGLDFAGGTPGIQASFEHGSCLPLAEALGGQAPSCKTISPHISLHYQDQLTEPKPCADLNNSHEEGKRLLTCACNLMWPGLAYTGELACMIMADKSWGQVQGSSRR